MTHYLDDLPQALESLGDLLELVFVPLLLAELIWLGRSRRLRWARIKEMLANVSSLLVLIPGAVLGFWIWNAVFDGLQGLVGLSIPTTPATALLCLVLVDLTYYLEHRFEHEHRLPWDLYHSVHHSSPEYDQTTSIRLSGFDALLTLGFPVPLVAIGFAPELVLAAHVVVIAYQTWIHTELIDRMPRWFELVFNSASHHRVHHGVDDEYLDRNYGGILILWDRWFGTFQAERERPTYGLTTQIESSNPVDVQFSELRKLVRDLRGDRSWRTRLRRLWRAPGWQPGSTESSESRSVGSSS